ncbi:right-handed parallel beta-helix repeat-containing protein [Micromonospora sp. LZ34]
MRTPRWAQLAVVPLIGGAGLVGPAAPAVAAAQPAAAQAAAPGSELYVNKKTCVPGGNGSADSPFCTIAAALAVVEPGQTVLVQPGSYPEKVTLTRSGTESAPITLRAVNNALGLVRVGSTVTGTIVTLAGVHDVVVEGFTVLGRSDAVPVLVDGSARVTVDGIATNTNGKPAVRVTGASTDVTVSRGWFPGTGTGGVAIEAGVTGAVVTASTFRNSGIAVTDAPGTVVTGNTVVTDCTSGIEVAGVSPGVALRNNVVRTGAGPVPQPTACADPARATAISVSAASTPQTVADHNLIDPAAGGALYHWGGTDHTGLDSFRAASGQGAHDIAAPALLAEQRGSERGWFPLTADSPAVDSADGTATGATRTDLLDNAHADAPTVANTGTGGSYQDRGAVELQGKVSVTGDEIRRKVGGNPLDVVVPLAATPAWATDGPVGKVARRFGDERFARVGPITPTERRFRRAGAACVLHHVRLDNFRVPSDFVPQTPVCTVVGANYTAVTPTRLLDTRAAIGIGSTVPVGPNSEIVLPIMSVNGIPAADVTAVVLNMTVTQPTAGGFLTVYPDGTPPPTVSNLNFVAGETVPNLVTVPMSNGNLRIRNGSSGTVHVVADLQGFYSGVGHGFKPMSPVRVLDSRANGGAPFAANGYRVLDLSGRVPAGATAAVLNVTVTKPTAYGVLKVYPYNQAVPATSNLNFVPGQTIPNLVTVPVVNRKLVIQNVSSGTTHVLADLAGWYGAGATDVFVPYGPRRVLDTRSGGGAPQAPFTSLAFPVPYLDPSGDGSTPEPTAIVANLTVTAPTAAGVLSAEPDGDNQQATSNVNFVAGETASNHAIVRVGSYGRVVLFNNSPGSTHFVVDQAGHFIAGTS